MTLEKLKSWEGLLLIILILTILANATLAPQFLTLQNQINLFQLSIEKIIVALAMTLIIINAEIDLSVASIMGLAACTFGVLVENGTPAGFAILFLHFIGSSCRRFQRTLDCLFSYSFSCGYSRNAHHVSRHCSRTSGRPRH